MSTTSNCQFFFNKSYFMKYTNAKTEATRHLVPGYHYFKKMHSFMDSHCIIGEMFLEYLNGACKEIEEIRTLCDVCSTREQCCEEIERVARRFPTTKVVGIIIFLLSKTQRTNDSLMITCHGYCWTAASASGQCSLDDPSSISTKFDAAEACVKDYLELLTVLDLKKDKRKKERLAEGSKTYQEYD